MSVSDWTQLRPVNACAGPRPTAQDLDCAPARWKGHFFTEARAFCSDKGFHLFCIGYTRAQCAACPILSPLLGHKGWCVETVSTSVQGIMFNSGGKWTGQLWRILERTEGLSCCSPELRLSCLCNKSELTYTNVHGETHRRGWKPEKFRFTVPYTNDPLDHVEGLEGVHDTSRLVKKAHRCFYGVRWAPGVRGCPGCFP